MELRLNIERSKLGIPCLWESGGCRFDDDMGDARIICAHHGFPKKAIFIKRRGELECGEHALIPVDVCDRIITAMFYKDNFFLGISKIVDIEEAQCIIEPCNDETDSFNAAIKEAISPSYFKADKLSAKARLFEAAVRACIKKLYTYHCKEAVYIK